MKMIAAALALISLPLLLVGCSPGKDATGGDTAVTELVSWEQKASYVFGRELASSVERMPASFDVDGLTAGLADVLADQEPEVSSEEASSLQDEINQKMMAHSSAGPDAGEPPAIDRRGSYALGMDMGSYVQGIPSTFDTPSLVQGLKDALTGAEPLLADEEATTVRQELFSRMQTAQAEQMQEAGGQNRIEGETFLAQNRVKPGVQTTASGLQYRVVTEGDGPVPTKEDRVRVHYRGTLIDGTEFDSSYSRGEPAVFPVGGVIAGWTEALQLMKVGSKYELFIRSELAYGERGAGGAIGPHATLLFEVELLGIEE